MKLVLTQSNLTLKGGAERVVLEIAKHYKAKIYTSEYDRDNTLEGFEDLDVELIEQPGVSRMLPYGRVKQGVGYGLGFYNKVIEDDYDVINAHVSPSHWIRNKNERVLWYCHTPLREAYDLYDYRQSLRGQARRIVSALGMVAVRRMDRQVVRKIEGIFANSNNTKRRIEKYLNRLDATVLNPAVDYKLYSNRGDEKFFVYPSRFSPNKRQDYAIRAFQAFKNKYKTAHYRLVLLGSVSNDRYYSNYYDNIVRLAKSVGDVEVITDPKERTDEKLRDIISRSTAVLYTPIDEDFGMIPLDAMASGKVIIAVNQGGPRETVVNGKTGYLANSESDMADMMVMVVEHPKVAEEMGKRGMERVRENYSWERFFKIFDKKLEEVKRK